jgi:heat-inducible transcriptional repressor
LDMKQRSRQILVAAVDLYIREGFPVGSRTMTEQFDFGVSPATIRSIMAELEEGGFLSQPHTSAGRIPTEKGYRFYVDGLISERGGFPEGPISIEEGRLTAKRDDLNELLRETSQLLSLMSHYAGIVLAPDISYDLLKRLEIVKLRDGQFLVIVITQDGILYNRVIEMDEDLGQDDLDRMARFLNAEFAGLNLHEVRRRLLHGMEQDKNLYDRMMQKVIELGQRAMRMEPESEFFLGGASNILELPDFADHEAMKALFSAFEEKAVIVKLLNRCLEAEGVNVVIGSEIRNQSMGNCSVVTARYRHGHTLGTLGIIGPQRMAYSRIIPLVEHTANVLTRVLNQG